MIKNTFTLLIIILLIGIASCSRPPTTQTEVSKVVVYDEPPEVTDTSMPTDIPIPTQPPTEAPTATHSPEPTTAPQINTPLPTPWDPQSPELPCQPSESKHCSILYILAEQYDDEHVLKTKPAFERNGYQSFVASYTMDEIRGFHECYDFTPAQPNLLLEEVDVMDYDAIIFAGADHSNTIMHDDVNAHRIAREAMASSRVVAAISDGPVILAKAGVLEGRTVNVIVNVYMHGVAEQWLHAIERAGAIYTERSPYRDGLLITADVANIRVAYGILEVIDEVLQ